MHKRLHSHAEFFYLFLFICFFLLVFLLAFNALALDELKIPRKVLSMIIRAFIRLATVLVLCAQLAACQAVAANEQIPVATLATQIKQGTAPLILDVRSSAEYAAGHIPGAINIDYRDIPEQLNVLRNLNSNSNSSEIVVYCEKGVRADIADTLLTDSGFTSIQLDGSMSAWRAAGLPIVAGESTSD